MKIKKYPKYKEVYPRDLYELIIQYAKKYSEITETPLLTVIREQTPIYFFIGNYQWDFDLSSKYSVEFEDRVNGDENLADVIFNMQNKYYQRLTNEDEWFGCFKYKYVIDRKTSKEVIKIHFRNVDETGLGPLSSKNFEKRIDELKAMFLKIKFQHPQIQGVQGSSWLYNLESYKRLFPRSYTENMKTTKFQTKYMVIWGQFVNSDKNMKDNLRSQFLNSLENVKTVEEFERCFPYKVLNPQAEIENFYNFYNI